MKINRVFINNFRSIKSLEFCPTDICAIVGENNAGKTNILAALNFLLGENWPSRQRLEARDYYNQDTTEPIDIEVWLEENPYGVGRIWCTIPWQGKAETKFENSRGNEQYLTNEIRDQCALVYLDATRNLEQHLGYSRWTLFGRIIRELDIDFRQNASEASQKALKESFNTARDLLRTNLFSTFEETFKASFGDQLKRTTHEIEIDFQTFDLLNYYRSLQPLLVENFMQKNLTEAGQGMRNLILLALFRTYAKVFKGDAIIAIEEPEIYLHPHAQRSLAALFQELAAKGNQIFYSTHSGNFIHIDRFDEICLIEKKADDEWDVCTQAQQVSAGYLLEERRRLYPQVQMSENGLRERYRNICSLEHNEAFFANKIVLVEGETEEYALPIYTTARNYDFNAHGVSIVNAHGKSNLDQLYQLYNSFNIPVYLIFDNDRGGNAKDLEQNKILLRMLRQPESREPPGTVRDKFAILEGKFEEEMESYMETIQPGEYARLKAKATERLGSNAGKGLVARFMAKRLTAEEVIPEFIGKIIDAVQVLGTDDDFPF
ncbi:MAG TPA: AAA family ATPase [Candidatus Binatia bacterium]|jgi:putative ATP-dependent endonuclease of OLD family|nr:AAA family ATPase [Candidatus Binatia bacterium]